VRGKFWRLRIRVASGIIALVPLVVTFVVVRWVLLFTSGILLPVLDPAVTEWPWILQAALSLLTLLVGLYLLGELAAHVVGKRMLGLGENLVLKVPMVKGVYGAAKQIVAAFQGPGSKAFKSVVFVPFPHPGTRAVGFVTSSISATDGEVWNTVFVPTTPNPTSGFLQLMPEKDVVTTDLTVEEGVKMVMSLGALVPERTARFF
jgi:uncharacterized membrane protein